MSRIISSMSALKSRIMICEAPTSAMVACMRSTKISMALPRATVRTNAVRVHFQGLDLSVASTMQPTFTEAMDPSEVAPINGCVTRSLGASGPSPNGGLSIQNIATTPQIYPMCSR